MKISEYYNSEEYAEKLSEVQEQAQELREAREEERKEKEKKVRAEKMRLKKIFTEERCGKENMHFVLSLIDRAAFLRIEIEYIEKQLQAQGCLDFFIQGTQTMWREHPLSKVHVQHSKSYRDTITKLESYGKGGDSVKADSNPIVGLINKGNAAREKYKL